MIHTFSLHNIFHMNIIKCAISIIKKSENQLKNLNRIKQMNFKSVHTTGHDTEAFYRPYLVNHHDGS